MSRFSSLFARNRCSIIGMIHVLPLPGTPRYTPGIQKIVDKACQEAEIYLECNIDSISLENMHDIPYVQSKHLQPETTAVMTKICTEIKKIVGNSIPLGLQILACGNKEALAVAKAADFNFIRAEGFVFSHVADEGFTDANAGALLRYRKQIDAENVLIFTDIKKKHSSHSITSDVSLIETAQAASFFLSDGIILTGTATGSPADVQELNDLKKYIKSPILIGSGVTLENFPKYAKADACIIGSYFKEGGRWENDLSKSRVKSFMETIETATLIENEC